MSVAVVATVRPSGVSASSGPAVSTIVPVAPPTVHPPASQH